MRTIFNISLPAPMAQAVDDAVIAGNFSSRSEFIRNLLRLWMDDKLDSDINQIKTSASRNNLSEKQAIKLIDQIRDQLPINQ